MKSHFPRIVNKMDPSQLFSEKHSEEVIIVNSDELLNLLSRNEIVKCDVMDGLLIKFLLFGIEAQAIF